MPEKADQPEQPNEQLDQTTQPAAGSRTGGASAATGSTAAGEVSPATRASRNVPSTQHREPEPEEEKKSSLLADLVAPVAGFGVTFATMFRHVYTEEYPDEKRPTAPRYHGRHQLNRYPDGLEKCIGCELCAWACPADAILVEGASNDDATGERFSPGERYGRVYQINYLRCIFCGLCIEACPTRALTMTNFYELADNNRADLIFTKDQLLAPMQEGMVPAPHPMVAGLTERDYYQGKVTEATPAQREWVAEREGERSSVDAQASAGSATKSSAGTAASAADVGSPAGTVPETETASASGSTVRSRTDGGTR